MDPGLVGAGVGRDGQRRGAEEDLFARWTERQAELRETVPIARRFGRKTRAVLSLPLPMVRKGDRINVNGEVLVSTTCVDRLPRCIGDRYGFDPRLRAQIVIAGRRRSAGPGTLAISRSVKHTCQQTRPNRNHHCPLVVSRASVVIDRPRRLPCRPSKCRVNMVVDAHQQRAEGGEVVLIGADRPDGSVDQGKARLNAAISREGAGITKVRRSTGHRLVRRLPPSPDGGHRIVYSQRMERLQAGDVLLVRARQRTAIMQLPYFIGSKVVVGTRPRAKRASTFARRIVPRHGTATETNGFNCTLGPSAFRSPCVTKKAGLALIRRTPRRPGGGPRPLFVNLVSRGFPKPVQARLAYPPLRVIRGGELTVTRLRATSGGPAQGARIRERTWGVPIERVRLGNVDALPRIGRLSHRAWGVDDPHAAGRSHRALMLRGAGFS